jgi:bacteriorhodopsin
MRRGTLAIGLPPSLERALGLVRVDFAPTRPQPSAARVAAASVLSIAGSLGADAVLVVIGTAVFPSTKGYVHFQFSDYAKLTIIGVVIACLAWPVVTRISSEPRWLFFRMAIAVTLILWLPDLYILAKGQPPRAVAVLVVMHLAIAVVTYNCLVRIAPVKTARAAGLPAPGPDNYTDRST